MEKNNDMKTDRGVLPIQVDDGAVSFSGVVKVHESVVLSIVRKAACSVPGVARMAGNSFVNNLADIVGSRKIFDRAINIEMGDNSVRIEAHLVLRYGCSIPETASAVQQAVADEILRITGMTAVCVNIIVSDLEDDEENGEEAEDGEETEHAGGSGSGR